MSEPDDLTAEEEQVRRLLADARHTAPVPDDVATRLDAVLADLRDEDPATPAPLVATQRPADLAAARRRHNVRTWVVAAAAVVAVGFGINQLTQLDVTGHSDSDSASSADGANAEAGGGDRAGHRHRDQPELPASAPAEAGAVPAPIRLDPDRFGTQVTRLRTQFGLVRTTGSNLSSPANDPAAPSDGVMSLNGAFSAYAATCPTTGWGRGEAIPVRYDHQPGVLVFRPVRGDTQVVDLFLCGSDDPERSITLPAP